MKIETIEDIQNFEKIQTQLISLHVELSLLSKKAPNDSVNIFKLKLINTVISRANDILENKNLPFDDFNQFDVEEIPSNSDVVLVLGQYINCLDERKITHIIRVVTGYWYWRLNGEKTEIVTSEPKKVNK